MTRLGFVVLLVVGCEGGSSPATPDALAVDAALDAPVDRPLRAVPSPVLVSRGAPGAEVLWALTPDGERELSDGVRAAWCGDKPFCNLPPNGNIGRFAALQYVGSDRAFYVDLDVHDWKQTRVVSADLATGTRTDLGAAITWPTTTPDWPLFYVVASATAASSIWISVPIEGGMALYRTDGRSPAVEVARELAPAAMTYMESTVEASANGVVWSVRWRRGIADPDPYAYVAVVLDGNGAPVLRVPHDLPDAVDGADTMHIVDGVAVLHWEHVDGSHPIELFDIAARTRRPIAGTYVHSLAPGGDGVVLVALEDRTRVVSTSTGAVLDTFDGQPWGTAPGVIYYRASDGSLHERAWATRTDRELAPATSLMLDAMAGRRTPDSTRLAVGAGAPYSDLSDNVGIELVDLATLARATIEPPDISETFVRRMQFSPDGAWLLYLHPIGTTLQLAGYELATGTYATFTTGTTNVRQVVVRDASASSTMRAPRSAHRQNADSRSVATRACRSITSEGGTMGRCGCGLSFCGSLRVRDHRRSRRPRRHRGPLRPRSSRRLPSRNTRSTPAR